ncbi:MAG: malto-oligosyltrehalose trehalohydrolase [Verrucomicrobia bacterium]|nr:malto-oligosyltrehalose trehalohydrolase [Verrucomicrobiota bacterium]
MTAGSLLAPPAVGAQVTAEGVQYCVWAPTHQSVDVAVQGPRGRKLPLFQDEDGFWSCVDAAGKAGDLYHFVLTQGRGFPDPASRFQPLGVHGPSECIDPAEYHWQSRDWSRPGWCGQSIYELHVGTFTKAGTFRAAIEKLDHVRALGVEAIELMPLADFAGARNWGYDGVCLYAPARCYGRPDDLRALVDAAHQRGLAVILDVVYNHLGPEGNYLPQYCEDYFKRDGHTPWGSAPNLEGPRHRHVRDFLLGSAAAWLDDYRFDGLRVDATHALQDQSATPFLAELGRLVHAREGFVIAEDDRNTPRLQRERDGRGYQFDAAWADDFHHQVRVALTGTRESYYGSYQGTAWDVAETLDHGWTYRGQPYPFWRGRPRGEPCRHLPSHAFVACIENHDQIGNRARGERLEHLVSPAKFRAASMLLCLGPYVPLLFMGQEWASASPFLFFTDREEETPGAVLEGRKKEFRENGLNLGIDEMPNPEDPATFERSKLDWNRRNAGVLALYRACLAERRRHLLPRERERERWQAGVVGDAVVVRYFQPEGDRALVFATRALGIPRDVHSLLTPPPGHDWVVVLASEASPEGFRPRAWSWEFPGAGAVWLRAVEQEDR